MKRRIRPIRTMREYNEDMLQRRQKIRVITTISIYTLTMIIILIVKYFKS